MTDQMFWQRASPKVAGPIIIRDFVPGKRKSDSNYSNYRHRLGVEEVPHLNIEPTGLSHTKIERVFHRPSRSILFCRRLSFSSRLIYYKSDI